MNKILFSIALLAMTVTMQAQPPQRPEAEIRKLEQAVVRAILDSDTVALKQLWAPEFMVNNPRNEISPDRKAVLRIQKAGTIDYASFERVIEQIQFQENMIITMGHETFVPKHDIPGAKAGQTQKRRFTNIWARKDGRWQQIARHASVICQQN